jgi:hypothetical protein
LNHVVRGDWHVDGTMRFVVAHVLFSPDLSVAVRFEQLLNPLRHRCVPLLQG